MKRILIAIAILFFGTGFKVHANQKSDSLFVAANQYYAEGVFDSAAVAYEKIINEGYESPEVYFNLGNSFYKLSNYSKAIINYERALLLKPGDEAIQHNLAKARFYNIDTLDEIPQFVLRRWINSLIILFHSNIWALISVICFILGLAFLVLYLSSMQLGVKRIGFYLGVIMLLFSLTTFSVSYKSKQLVVKSNGAIVTTSTVTVKSSPRDSGTDLFIIHEGTKVFILNSIDDWYEIKLSDGKQGWLLKNNVEVI